jgi:hypothetical protein
MSSKSPWQVAMTIAWLSRLHLPEAPPILFKPFNKSCTEEVAECAAQNCANEYGVTREKWRIVENEHARAETKPTSAQATEKYSGDDVMSMAFFCHCGITGHLERIGLIQSVRAGYTVLGNFLLRKWFFRNNRSWEFMPMTRCVLVLIE